MAAASGRRCVVSGQITAGAGVLTAVLVAGTGLARWWVADRPPRGGRHRAPAVLAPAPLPTPKPVPGGELVEALVYETAHCPTCHRDTEHVRFALGGLMCPSCPPWGRP